MSIQPNQLLQRLAGLAAGRAGPSPSSGAAAADPAGFQALLRRAAQSPPAQRAAVDVETTLNMELTDDQLARLAAGADAALAQGLERALVMLDGHALVLDVQSRRVIARLQPGDAVALGAADIDGVVAAPEADVAIDTTTGDHAQRPPVPAAPADVLLRLLDRAWDRPALSNASARHAAR